MSVSDARVASLAGANMKYPATTIISTIRTFSRSRISRARKRRFDRLRDGNGFPDMSRIVAIGFSLAAKRNSRVYVP
jgi:hypothetical protein